MQIDKSHLAKTLADRTGLSALMASQAIAAMWTSIARSLAAGTEVRISGFGKFEIQTRKRRTGRNPRTGGKIDIQSRRTVSFKGFKHLKNRINDARGKDAAPPGPGERRGETDRQALPQGRAVVRICGIPVCEFTVKDISGNGTSFLMARDSVVLRNLQVGQEIEIHMVFADGNRQATMQRSKIAHITHPKDGTPYQGFVLVGLRVIDRI